MRASTIAAAATVLAVSHASVVRQAAPLVADSPQKCTKADDKCAGAPNQPRVEYAPCCDADKVCGIPTEVKTGTWGHFCIDKADAETILTADGVTTEVVTTTKVGDTTVAPAAGDTTVAPAAGDTTKATDGDSTTVETGAGGVKKGSKTKTKGSKTKTTDASESAEPSASDEEKDDDSACFPADATVELQDGSVIRMDAVSVGGMVKVAPGSFSRVFMFTHKLADTTNDFVTLATASGAELSLTSGHYLYVNGALSAAKTVVTGDELTLGNGQTISVTSVGSAEGAGLFNPQTVNGNVVVDGVMASTYTTAVEPTLAHAVLAPFRALQNFGFAFTALESGGGALADVAPRGQAAF